MARVTVPANLTPQVWDKQYFREFLNDNVYRPFFGKSKKAIIRIKEDLLAKKGRRIWFELINALKADGVTGSQRLKGNEERLTQRSHPLDVALRRHAVIVDEWEEQMTEIDLRNASKAELKEWQVQKLITDIIDALSSIDGVNYADATTTQKNAWHDNNLDRVLYGAAIGNFTASDHAASLANVDSSADKLTGAMGMVAKRIASKTASPKIRPYQLKNGTKWYIMFCNSWAFRDLSNDSAVMDAQKYAAARGKDNPLFTAGDIIYRGMIYKEDEEIPVISGVGASSIDVAPNYLCGAGALGLGYAQRPKTTTDVDDYDFDHGVGIQEMSGVTKLRFGTGEEDTDTPKDHGIVTVFTSGVADA